MGLPWQEYWSGLPFPLPVDHILPELSTMICLSRVALHGMTHSFTELCPSFLLENSRPLSPWGPLNFLETCLGNDSLRNMIEQPLELPLTFPGREGALPEHRASGAMANEK